MMKTLGFGAIACILLALSSALGNAESEWLSRGRILFSAKGLQVLEVAKNCANAPRTITAPDPLIDYSYPTWAPGAKAIASGYSDMRDMLKTNPPQSHSVIVTMDQAGKDIRTILDEEGASFDMPSYSGTGRYLSSIRYTRTSEDEWRTHASVVIFDLPTGQKIKKIPGVDYAAPPAWAPRKNLVAYTTEEQEICLYDVDSNLQRNLSVRGQSPIFSADGLRILFLENVEAPRAVMSVDLDGKDRKTLLRLDASKQAAPKSELILRLLACTSDGNGVILVGYRTVVSVELAFLQYADFRAKTLMAICPDMTGMSKAAWIEP